MIRDITIIIICLFSLNLQVAFSQVENLQISHPVYQYLERAEARGFLPNMSLNDLPLQRGQVIEALKMINENDTLLSDSERNTLRRYLIEFGINSQTSRIVFPSSTDSTQILFSGLLTDDEKFIYRYKDSTHSASFIPLASAELMTRNNNDGFDKAFLGHLGFRLFGTLGNSLGFNLQVTNGALLNGNRELALTDMKYSQNIKFAVLESDIDYTESHIRYQHDWFYAGIGRESRLTGAGFKQRLIMSDNPPAFDAIVIGARTKGFEYKFMHASLLSLPQTYFGWETGPNVKFVPKYMVTHRLSVRPSWGEISFFENIIYSDRFYDLGYLNPLSFLKSLEHALRDRDNAGMGIDATVRIVDGVQVKGTYFLDDVIFSNIGKGYWGNKAAWNLGVMYSPTIPFDFGVEYTRVEPFTFSHFNIQNSMTHDSYIVSSYLQPNSDRFTFFGNYWWGNRYPLEFAVSYRRWGRNVFDEDGELIKNVGGSALQTHRPGDPTLGYLFMDGDAEYLTTLDLKTGYEFFRGFNFMVHYTLYSINSEIDHFVRFTLRFDEF
ncbi:MAG: hypothetical protein KIT33_02855 [Candidatus Kapabacteria bacterium]|nr:hypothetical protein [Ignavibacteriota bacterium]MCW5883889.1 hypothetical protein [Candidatus Kapabacteria bacterium]